ncbi:Fur family zinc uptake regulator [Melghiribacillus thermohalophilus]|uniref:Fur family zinc uptake regulator n=1 Tax=Melghiribacillus thermohalophilus TaxID=1324956 RepID=A0A4R3MNX4_9BACI|nr:Fur family transcriptional regulator [Melghiribacillus thermohalophilus]TCT15971.1 Fur family zinc uptake regulator [Melghiribacillus thermohalophilus]
MGKKVTEALQKLKHHGYKYTDKREDMLEFFGNYDGYRTASDVQEFMKERYDGISFDTIYRNLHLFHDLGILEATELNGEKHFRMKCDTSKHHHHLICKECGKTREIELCPMEYIEKELKGFRIDDHKFEIYGVCYDCQST